MLTSFVTVSFHLSGRRARMVFELPCDLHPDALVQRLYEWLQLVGLFFALHRNGMALGEASMTAVGGGGT